MEILKQRILKDGVVKEGNVLKVDKFLNHQMDVKLFNDIGEEFAKRFAGTGGTAFQQLPCYFCKENSQQKS